MKTVGVAPKLTASGADALRKELKLFYNYVNDARVKDRAKYFKLARTNASGTFLAELDLDIASEIGKTEVFYKAVEEWPSEDWTPKWDEFLERIKHVVGLNDSCELGDATREYNRVQLGKGASVDDIQGFLTRYTEKRAPMVDADS